MKYTCDITGAELHSKDGDVCSLRSFGEDADKFVSIATWSGNLSAESAKEVVERHNEAGLDLVISTTLFLDWKESNA